MQDRFADIAAATLAASKERDDVHVEIELKDIGNTNDNEMNKFYEEVGQIRTLNAMLNRNVTEIQRLYNEQMASVEGTNSTSPEELQDLIQSSSTVAAKVRAKLQALKQETDQMSDEVAQKRVREHMHTNLTKKFIENVQQFQNIQNAYKIKFRERFQRQATIVKPDISEEEVNRILETGDTSQVFADALLSDHRHAEARAALVDMQRQQRELVTLEKSINELNQMFIDFATMIQVQGEVITQIQENIQQAANDATTAVGSLTEAEKYANIKRRNRIFAIVGIVVALVIAAGVIAAIIALTS
eukprot:TRINITY_DN610_c3_g1_i1.p1 TRINITY_DN610_c3_g1~~TRINITY_DN610_c3_g1_i1.p1  ORF type:complete len:302 (+),score=178.09 TRINITY_DN610_c3_g1_i1:158-1063(+)